MYQVNAYKGLS